MEVPDSPLVFTKFPSCLVGPTADVEIRSDGCDYEGELVVVIGEGGKDISVEDAWDHVVGVTVGQDISDRPAQFAAKPPHFDLAKSFDTFGPIGPVVVSTDELTDRDSLHIVCEVNGEVRQDGNTADLIFDVPTLVSFLSYDHHARHRRRDLHRDARWYRDGAGQVPRRRRRHHHPNRRHRHDDQSCRAHQRPPSDPRLTARHRAVRTVWVRPCDNHWSTDGQATDCTTYRTDRPRGGDR